MRVRHIVSHFLKLAEEEVGIWYRAVGATGDGPWDEFWQNVIHGAYGLKFTPGHIHAYFIRKNFDEEGLWCAITEQNIDTTRLCPETYAMILS